ncbi:MAG: AsmA-like C-terminal region-containing protein, partial [Bacteroidota bacterium]
MKTIKRILIAVVVLLVLGVGFLLAAPILFKDQIVANVKIAAEKAVDAEVDFSDIHLSFLRSFPEVSLRIEDLSIIGIDTFAGTPLVTSKEVEVDVGFWSVVGGDGTYNIDAVRMDEPFVNLLVLGPDLANYLIVPESADDPAVDPNAAPASAQINLNHYEITNGHFVYDDRGIDTYLEITGLNTTGDGDFTATVFDLDTYSEAASLTLKQGGVAYLKEIKTVANALVNIDLNNNRYTFLDNELTLNELLLNFGGSISLEDNDDIVFDLDYSAPANDFRQLWSIIPATYTQGYDQVKTTGLFTLKGTVDGPYNGEKELYPAFTVSTEISDGSVQYPGRPVGINGIDAAVAVNSPSSDLNQLKVDIPRFRFNLGGDPFEGSFRLSTPLSDPNVDARLNGTIDLDKWAKAIPLEGVRELGGKIIADVTMRNVRQSILNAGRYAEVALSGTMRLDDLVYVAEKLPAVRINKAQASFTPQAIDLENFDAKLGRSDLRASGQVTTPLAYFSPEQTMRGDLVVRSEFFDADEWMPPEEAATASPAEIQSANPTAVESEVFDRFDFSIDAEIDQLSYAGYRPEKLRASGNIKPNKLEISQASGTMGESSFAGSGTINNLFDYTFADGILGGNLNVRSPFLNVADFMDEEVTTATASSTQPVEGSAVIPVPSNINLAINVLADQVKYTDITLNDLVGALVVQGGQAVLEDGSARLLGGRMNFAGAYDTSEPGDPGFRFHYDLQSLDFRQAFAVLNTFEALAPVGKFLEGQFSTDLVLEGKLGPDLFPKLNTIDAKGLFRTAEAKLAGITPLRKVGQALNIEELSSSTTLSNIITVFQVEDGKVAIEPFNLKLAGITMQVAGTHGLEQDMDYNIQAAIPRELIKGNFVTGTALSALDKLAGQASKLGLNISPGDTLNVAIGLTGSFSDPNTSFKLLGSKDGTGQSLQDAVVDNLKDQAQEELDNQRAEVEERVNEEVAAVQEDAQRRIDSLRAIATDKARATQDSIRNAAAAQADRLRKEAEEKLKLRLDSIRLDSLRRVLPPGVNNAANKVQQELEKFNPFKKKKKK